MSSDGRLVLVSGGSRGLGQAIVAHRLRQGDKVATFSRRTSESIESLRADSEIRDRLLFSEVDMRDDEGLRGFVSEAVARFGRIDALVNNAGIARDSLMAMASVPDIDRMLQVNLRGTFVLTRACIRPMLVAGSGRIVNITSIVGLRGYRGLAVYSATKAGLDAMTRALARELGPRAITVNSVAPGYLETEMTHEMDDSERQQILRRTPLGRLGRPEDVLPVLDFLLCEASRFITGQVLVVDGGVSC